MDKISKFTIDCDYDWKVFTDPTPVVFAKWLNVYYHPRRSLRMWDGAESKHTTKQLFDYFSKEVGSNVNSKDSIEFGEWILSYFEIWNPDDITWIDGSGYCSSTEQIFEEYNDPMNQ